MTGFDLEDPKNIERWAREQRAKVDETEKWLAHFFSEAFARARAGSEDTADDLFGLRERLEFESLEELAHGAPSIDDGAAYVEAVEEFNWTPPGGGQEQYVTKDALIAAKRPVVLANRDRFRKTDRRPSDESGVSRV
jgi:hypothetical protein